jgi:hypothetical protein
VVGGVEPCQRGNPGDRDCDQHHRPNPLRQQPRAGRRADQHCDDKQVAERLYGDQCGAGEQQRKD